MCTELGSIDCLGDVLCYHICVRSSSPLSRHRPQGASGGVRSRLRALCHRKASHRSPPMGSRASAWNVSALSCSSTAPRRFSRPPIRRSHLRSGFGSPSFHSNCAKNAVAVATPAVASGSASIWPARENGSKDPGSKHRAVDKGEAEIVPGRQPQASARPQGDLASRSEEPTMPIAAEPLEPESPLEEFRPSDRAVVFRTPCSAGRTERCQA